MKGKRKSSGLNVETLHEILRRVSRAGRYIGGESFSCVKNRNNIRLSIALAFPDLYEIGMSYPGLQILYHVLNERSDIAAERVFAPWDDMEEVLSQLNIPLFSLETKLSLSSFDIVGFTLQYELTYTNILSILSLGRIPLRSDKRGEEDPIILGGGPCAFNPEPLAPFFDVFALGDGEEVILEIADFVKTSLQKECLRKDILRGLSHIPGVYVPALYPERVDEDSGVHAEQGRTDVPGPARVRILTHLKENAYPAVPILPNIKPVQDRLAVEIMRGCTHGCRFCQAGYIYRPARRRSVKNIVRQADRWIQETGYEEMSLISLSTSDYQELPQLMQEVQHALQPYRTSLALPSLRSDSFTRGMADYLKTGRFSGLTLALEAATPRLRRVINKNIDIDSVLKSVQVAVEKGWRKVKIYFMIGLPTETDEDVAAISKLLVRIRRAGRCKIHASISPFVPKPWTPFQWERQNSTDELKKKIALLRRNNRDRGVVLKWRNPDVSWLEGILSRGDRTLAGVIEAAYNSGARFDGWMDRFSPGIWQKAFESCGLDPNVYLDKRNVDSQLPWEHVIKGITREFLLAEREKAYKEVTTPDCRTGRCEQCGVMDVENCTINIERKRQPPAKGANCSEITSGTFTRDKTIHSEPVGKLRFIYQKKDFAVYLSHLDLGNIFRRALRWTRLSIVWSQGFHPHLRISYGPPLPTGYGGEREYFDVLVHAVPDHLEQLRILMQSRMPGGIEIIEVRELPLGKKHGSGDCYCYEVPIRLPDKFPIEETLKSYLSQPKIIANVGKNGKLKEIDLVPFLRELRYFPKENILRIVLRVLEGRTVKVEPVVETLFRRQFQDLKMGIIVRKNIIERGQCA